MGRDRKQKHKTQALTPSRTSERISILKMKGFMLIATFLLLGQTKGRKPLGLSSQSSLRSLKTNETGLVAALETFITEVESKLAAQQTSIDGIKENAKVNNECCDKEEDAKCVKYRGTMNVAREQATCKIWTESSYFYPSKWPKAGLEENYCRNPDPATDKQPWCYTYGAHRWNWCDVPSC